MQGKLENDTTEDKSIFYSYQKLLSYNAFLNFLNGGRGVGKSFGAKEFVANRFINHEDEFVYLRRYGTEVADATMVGKKPIFWNQLLAEKEEYKKYKMTNTSETFSINGKVCGYSIALSTANIKKSATFEKVKTIIFDEYTLDESGFYKYMDNEPTLFLELLETIVRMRNDCRVIFIGNNISSSNPYFDYFNLRLPYTSEYQLFNNGLILVNYIKDNEKFIEAKKKTKLGQLIDGTIYGDYNIYNKALIDNDVFLKKKDRNCKFAYNIKANNNIYGVWINTKEEYMLISPDYDRNYKDTFSIKANDHNEDTMLLSRNTAPLSILIEKYRMAHLFFENINTKNNILSVLDTYI